VVLCRKTKQKSLARLAGTSLMQYSRSLEEEKAIIVGLNSDGNHQSPEWTTAHLRLGEMQVRLCSAAHFAVVVAVASAPSHPLNQSVAQILHLLLGVGYSITKRLAAKLDMAAPENNVRDNPCPKKFLEAFYKQ